MSKVRKATTTKKRGRPFRVKLEDIPKEEPIITFDDFYGVLVRVDDIMSACHTNYVCRGNTLDVILGEAPAFTNPLTLAMLSTDATEYAISAMQQIAKPVLGFKNNKLIKIILPMGIINVEIAVLEGNFRPVKNFDLKFFNYDVWKIPNPVYEFERIMKEIYG